MNMLGKGQFQVFHGLDKALAGDVAAEPLIFIPFLTNGRNGISLIIVPRVDQRVRREGEEFLMDAVKQLTGITLLEIRAATASDQQGISREDTIRKDIADTATGVARSMANHDLDRSRLENHAIGDQKVRTHGPCIAVDHAFTAEAIP